MIETLLNDEEDTEVEEKKAETITDEFNSFLVERVVKVEIETLREELMREVENIPDSEVDFVEDSQNISELEHNMSEVDLNDISSEKFDQFLFKRIEAVKNESK